MTDSVSRKIERKGGGLGSSLTMGTGPALVFLDASLRFRRGAYSSACSKYNS